MAAYGYLEALLIWLHLGERAKLELEVAAMNGSDADRTDCHHIGLSNLEATRQGGERGLLMG
jgi:hypothetical protein